MQATWTVNGAAGGVDPADRGLAYGDGLFETMAAAEGAVPLLDYHLERLAIGCDRLAIPVPDLAGLRREIDRGTPARGRAIVKVIVTRGSAARGYTPPDDPSPNVLIGSLPWLAPPAAHYTQGIELATCELRLGENPKLAGLKHLCRLEQVMAQLELKARGFREGLLLSASGLVVGGTSSNVFAVAGGCVYTPQIDRCGVSGVMRRVVLETCATLRLPRAETDMGLETLRQADEVFFTNAVLGLRPVGRLDDVTYPVGPVTRAIRARLGAAEDV